MRRQSNIDWFTMTGMVSLDVIDPRRESRTRRMPTFSTSTTRGSFPRFVQGIEISRRPMIPCLSVSGSSSVSSKLFFIRMPSRTRYPVTESNMKKRHGMEGRESAELWKLHHSRGGVAVSVELPVLAARRCHGAELMIVAGGSACGSFTGPRSTMVRYRRRGTAILFLTKITGVRRHIE